MIAVHPLKRHREQSGTSRKVLADTLGVSEVTVGRWETGKRGIRKSLLPKIEDACGIAADEILRFERGA